MFWALLLLLLYTSVLFSVLENKLISHAEPSLGARVTVAEFLSSDLMKVSAWSHLWGMKLNGSKTKTMIVSRSCTINESPVTHMNYCRNCAEGV